MPDKDDRHVVAAAIATSAQKILTWNLGDFPSKVLKVFGVVAESPDRFIAGLIVEDPVAVVEVFRIVRQRFKAPPMSVAEFFQRLERNSLTSTARHLQRYRDLM